MLTREQILGIEDLKPQAVEVPEWGGSIFVRAMTGSERDRFAAAHSKGADHDASARLVASVVCDEKGDLLFTPADVAALGKKSAGALDRVLAAVMALNKLRPADIDAQEDFSAATPSASSPSA